MHLPGAYLEEVVFYLGQRAPGVHDAVRLQLEHKRLPGPVEAGRGAPAILRVAAKDEPCGVANHQQRGRVAGGAAEQRP